MIERAIALIESVKEKNVLFIGETITDEYRFVSPMSKPSKENILAVRFKEAELYEGGVLAACKHVESFCNVAKITVGNEIRKVRYVEENYTRKLFEVQHIQDGPPKELLPVDVMSRFDVVAVTDFGHCMLSPELVKQVCEGGFFLAVATQTNAHNAGFNLITKYPRADYICIDEPEARLAAADRDSPIEDVIRKLADGRCSKFVVTHGRHGAYGYQDGRFLHSPAFTERVTDTMGAGDAFFAITAAMAEEGDIEDLLTIGNAAGALKTQIVGHRKAVTKDDLVSYLRAHGTH